MHTLSSHCIVNDRKRLSSGGLRCFHGHWTRRGARHSLETFANTPPADGRCVKHCHVSQGFNSSHRHVTVDQPHTERPNTNASDVVPFPASIICRNLPDSSRLPASRFLDANPVRTRDIVAAGHVPGMQGTVVHHRCDSRM